MSTTLIRRRWRPLAFLALLLGVCLPFGCSELAHKERELVFNIEPGTDRKSVV